MTFCYHQALKGYFYQCWKRIHISWMIDSNLYIRTQSPNSMRLSMLSLIFSTSQCLLNMTSGMAWTRKGIDCFNPTTINVMVPSSFTPTHSPDWLILCRFLQMHFIDLFFFICLFFDEHSQITGPQGKGEGISLIPHYHVHPLHRHLDISRAMTAESSPLHIASSRVQVPNH